MIPVGSTYCGVLNDQELARADQIRVKKFFILKASRLANAVVSRSDQANPWPIA
jgi:hypothetical protein